VLGPAFRPAPLRARGCGWVMAPGPRAHFACGRRSCEVRNYGCRGLPSPPVTPAQPEPPSFPTEDLVIGPEPALCWSSTDQTRTPSPPSRNQLAEGDRRPGSAEQARSLGSYQPYSRAGRQQGFLSVRCSDRGLAEQRDDGYFRVPWPALRPGHLVDFCCRSPPSGARTSAACIR